MTSKPPTLCNLVFFRRDNELLLAMKKRGFGAGRWNGVGGKLEPGETMEQALVRECQEEVGLTPTAWRKVAIHDFVMDSTGSNPWHMHVHAFICDQWDGEPHETAEMAPRWFTHNEIPYDSMWSDDSIWLPLVLKGNLLRCTFHFNEHDAIIRANLEIVTSLDDAIATTPAKSV